MKLRFGLMIVSSAVVCLSSLGVGDASANNEYAGKTYAAASDAITSNGGKATIASVVGSQMQIDDCVVMGSRKASNLDSSGTSRGYQILLDLDCNMPLAAPGKPGNSAASVTGAKAKTVMGWIEAWNKGSINSCIRSADAAQWCLTQCDKYGTCSAETQQTLASYS